MSSVVATWINDRKHEIELASFVLEGDDFVEDVVSRAVNQLNRLTNGKHRNFASAVVEASPDSLVAAAKAIYVRLAEDFHFLYEYEKAFRTATGEQQIRLPSQIAWANYRGTCLDLSLLYLSCLAHAKLWPVYVHLYGHTADHSLAALWLSEPPRDRAALLGLGELRQYHTEGRIRVLDAIGFAEGYPSRPAKISFATACREAGRLVAERGSGFALDIRRAWEVAAPPLVLRPRAVSPSAPGLTAREEAGTPAMLRSGEPLARGSREHQSGETSQSPRGRDGVGTFTSDLSLRGRAVRSRPPFAQQLTLIAIIAVLAGAVVWTGLWGGWRSGVSADPRVPDTAPDTTPGGAATRGAVAEDVTRASGEPRPQARAPLPPSAQPARPPTGSTSLVVADFDSCTGSTNLHGSMGASFTPRSANSLRERYIAVPARGCVAQLTYSIRDWSAFWLLLGGLDLSGYGTLRFDLRADSASSMPTQLKVELKRSADTLSVFYVKGISADWNTIRVSRGDWGPAEYGTSLPDFRALDQIVFTFEARFGTSGVVYLDNIIFEKP